MTDIEKLKCPTCGAHNGFDKRGDWFYCSSCYGQFHIVSSKTEERLRKAHDYMITYRFDDADEIYSLIALDAETDKDYGTFVTAEWGRLLAFFGVVYIRSFGANEPVPTFACYHADYASVKDTEYYESIMNADIEADIKANYEKLATKLDETYTRISGELDAISEYDVFICTKISTKTDKTPDANGYARDSRIASSLFDLLKKSGLSVFYSDICCHGIEYDSQIFSALLRSKTMIVIATEKDYLESRWVESEWRRWLNFIACEEKGKASLFLYFPDFNVSRFTLPGVIARKRIQYFTSDDMIKLIDNVTDVVKADEIARRKAEERAKRDAEREAAANAEIDRRVAEIRADMEKKLAEQQEAAKRAEDAQRAMEERLTAMQESQAEAERQAALKAKAEAAAKAKAEEERLAKERAEQEAARLAEEKAEAERQAVLQAEQEAAAKAEQERLAKERAEQEAARLAEEKAKAEEARLAEEQRVIAAAKERAAREDAKTDMDVSSEGTPGLVYEELPNGSLEVVGYKGEDKNVVIPDMHDGKMVRSISFLGYIRSNRTYNTIDLLTIPYTVVNIERAWCTDGEIGSVTIDPNNPVYYSPGNNIAKKEGNVLIYLCRDRAILAGIKKIGDDAIWGNKYKTVIKVPEGVKEIGSSAFACCYNLTKVVLPSSVEEIGDDVFKSCENIEEVVLPRKFNTFSHRRRMKLRPLVKVIEV